VEARSPSLEMATVENRHKLPKAAFTPALCFELQFSPGHLSELLCLSFSICKMRIILAGTWPEALRAFCGSQQGMYY